MKTLKASSAQFIRADSGAVTVDWVVLTAAIAGLGLATLAVVSGGTASASNSIDSQLSSDMIETSFGSSGFAWEQRVPTEDLWLPWPEYYGEDRYTDEALLSDIENYAMYADSPPGENDIGYDHYWAAIQEAERRGLTVPS